MLAKFQRVGLVSAVALAALAVYACGSDNNDNNNPSGDGDGDGDAGGGGDGDSGTPLDSGTAAVMCGEPKVACEGVDVLGGAAKLAACCSDPGDACGLDMTTVSALTQGLFPPGCLERNQPYAPADHKVSNFCTGFWEQLDAPEAAGTATNGFTVKVATQTISFNGCCREVSAGKGECGFAADTILGAAVNFGCLPLDDFKNAFTAGDAGAAGLEQVKAKAVCNPATGEAVSGGDAGAGDGGS
ncbi:MAG: hypothetical protein QM778_10290 [Myxococcales bacterium]